MVELDLPMHVRVEERFQQAMAVRRGPLYFAPCVGQDYRECPWDNPAQGPGKLSAKPMPENIRLPGLRLGDLSFDVSDDRPP